MTAQRYVSEELTHFVGRGLPNNEAQYSLLVNDILKGKALKHSPVNREPEELLERGSFTSRSPGPISTVGEMYETPYISFCDIPVTVLEIHMAKYSRFGLSFRRPFLIKKGANPIFYIANNSQAVGFGLEQTMSDVRQLRVPRRTVFEQNVHRCVAYLHDLCGLVIIYSPKTNVCTSVIYFCS